MILLLLLITKLNLFSMLYVFVLNHTALYDTQVTLMNYLLSYLLLITNMIFSNYYTNII